MVSFLLLLVGFLGWLIKDLQHIFLKHVFLNVQTVFLPDELGHLWVKLVLGLAVFPQRVNVFVVWITSEGKRSTVDHEVLELLWLALAELVDGDFLLLFLDVIIFFVLRSSWKSLPWQGSS